MSGFGFHVEILTRISTPLAFRRAVEALGQSLAFYDKDKANNYAEKLSREIHEFMRALGQDSMKGYVMVILTSETRQGWVWYVDRDGISEPVDMFTTPNI